MKNLIPKIVSSLFIFLIGVSGVFGQENILGVWQLDAKTVMSEMGVQEIGGASDSSKAKKSKMDEDLSSKTFSFYEGGRFVANWNFGEKRNSSSGRWRIDGSNLILDLGKGEKVYKIIVNNSKKLILFPEGEKRGIKRLIFDRTE